MTLEQICNWKQTMINNQQGIGTSFGKDITKYTERQLQCHFCSGYKTKEECAGYDKLIPEPVVVELPDIFQDY